MECSAGPFLGKEVGKGMSGGGEFLQETSYAEVGSMDRVTSAIKQI